jgi:hypothetical protein
MKNILIDISLKRDMQMANKYMNYSLVTGRYKLKPQRDSSKHPLEWLK